MSAQPCKIELNESETAVTLIALNHLLKTLNANLLSDVVQKDNVLKTVEVQAISNVQTLKEKFNTHLNVYREIQPINKGQTATC